jgi:putative ABC transport system permease protein
MASSLRSDIRHALRGLVRTPQVTVAAILCLGLGLGSTTAIYSAVYTALIRPLPFRNPDALVSVFRTTPHFNTGPFSPANYLDLRNSTQTIETLASATPGSALLEGRDETVRAATNRVSGNLFDAFGVAAIRGRLLEDADDTLDRARVAVLSEEFWRRHYGGDAGVVGTAVRLDGEPYEVVGIAPREFRIPHGRQLLRGDVWVPLRFSPDEASTRGSNYLSVMGRLRPGISAVAADAEMRRIMQGIAEQYRELQGELLRVEPLRKESVRSIREPLLMLFGAVGFVLLIAAANVASLLLARGVSRRREMSLRAVLGAKPWDVVRPVLIESGTLTVAGTALGLVLAAAGIRVIRALAPARLPQLADLTIDWKVLTFSLAVAVGIALICGIAPAWRSGRDEPHDALRSSGRTGASRGQHRFLRLIVAAEVSLSLVLLLGAGLLLRGFEKLISQDPGFDSRSLLTVIVTVPPDRYTNQSTVDAFLTPAMEAIRAIPGVQDAGAIMLLPYDNWGWNFNIRYEGQPAVERTQLPLTEIRSATPSLFSTLGMRLLSGRLLSADDAGRPDGPYVAVANEALVKRDFPDEDPIGKRYHLSDTTFATIVGVVSDIRNFGPESPPQPELYWVYGQRDRNASSFPVVIRVAGDPMRFAQPASDAIRSVEKLSAISEIRTMDEIIARSVGRPRFYLTLLTIFAGVALLLSIAGLYGLMSYAVAQRTREIGVRAALGSTPARTLRLIMRQGLMLVALGAVVGMLAGLGLTRLLGSLLYGVSPLDFLTWAGVTVALCGAGALAILVPARRASSVQPLIALREE